MICPNCKSHIENSVKYCNYCGEKLASDHHDSQYNYSKKYSDVKKDYKDNHSKQFGYSKNYSDVEKDYEDNHNDQFNYSRNYSNVDNDYNYNHYDHYSYSEYYSNTSDDDYLNIFLGNNYKLIKSGIFSICAFIFGPFYLLYKKMWSQGLLLLALIGIITIYNTNIATTIVIIIDFYLGFRFSKMYLEYANRKVDEIKLSNPDKTSTELLEICKQKGKPINIGLVLIIGFIFLIAVLALAIQKEKDNESIQEEVETSEMLNINFQVPTGYEINKYNTETHRFYSYHNNNLYCTFIINIETNTNMYPTVNNYIEKNSEQMDYDLDNSKVKKETINKKIWYTLEDNEKKDYMTIYNKKLYSITFKYSRDNTTCKEHEKQFMNSIEFSE